AGASMARRCLGHLLGEVRYPDAVLAGGGGEGGSVPSGTAAIRMTKAGALGLLCGQARGDLGHLLQAGQLLAEAEGRELTELALAISLEARRAPIPFVPRRAAFRHRAGLRGGGATDRCRRGPGGGRPAASCGAGFP